MLDFVKEYDSSVISTGQIRRWKAEKGHKSINQWYISSQFISFSVDFYCSLDSN
ncbi:hypothetical protein Hanom_Chr10g00906111 [Helianthus anomalus]